MLYTLIVPLFFLHAQPPAERQKAAPMWMMNMLRKSLISFGRTQPWAEDKLTCSTKNSKDQVKMAAAKGILFNAALGLP